MNEPTEGMTWTCPGDKARAEHDLKRGDATGVVFNHINPSWLPDDELLSLAQLNVKPPQNLLALIAQRGLNGAFRKLWQAGERGGL